MKALFTIFAVLPSITFFACNNHRTLNAVEIRNDTTKKYAQEPNDSAEYKFVKYNFYLSKGSNLCERKLALAWDTTCNCEFQVYYDSSFSIFLDDSVLLKPLNSIVDIPSFVWLDSTEFSKDKNRVYYFHGNSDGGLRVIVDNADPLTFKRLCDYRWGIDKNYVFYKTDTLNGVDLSKLQVLYPPDTSDHFIQYVKDDKKVFFENQIVKDADAKTFKVVSGQKWDAEDKNYKYESGRHIMAQE